MIKVDNNVLFGVEEVTTLERNYDEGEEDNLLTK